MAVESIGAFTAIGLGAAQTMSSLRARVQRFEELEVEDADGEPLVGAVAPLPREVRGSARLAAMAGEAFGECARGREREPAPLLCCCPGSREGGPDPSELIETLSKQGGRAVYRPLSRTYTSGHVAVVEALLEARRLLQSREVRACYVGGVDSLIDSARLIPMLEQDRIKRDGNPLGVVPGEGAAFLRLELASRRAPRPSIAGLGLEKPSEVGAGFAAGFALERALRAALADAGANVRETVCLAHDCAGERRAARDLAVAVARLGVAREQVFDLWDIATYLGETGAAVGPLTLAYLAFAMDRGHLAPGAMFAGSTASGLAAAAFIRASAKEEAHHGG